MKLNEDNNNGCLETYVVSLPTPKEAVSCRNYTHLTATRTNVALQQAHTVWLKNESWEEYRETRLSMNLNIFKFDKIKFFIFIES